VLGCLFVVNLAWVAVSKSQSPALRSLGAAIAIQLAYFAPLAVAVFARNARVVGGALGFLILLYLGLAAEALIKRL
jgi:hypothetical protein